MIKDKTLNGLILAVFLMMLGVGMIVALLPQRIIDLTGSNASVGYLASAFALSYTILQVPIGNLADRVGFKIFLMSGYLLCCVTGILFYLSQNANLIFLGRLIQGIGEAPIWALAPALLSIKYPLIKGKVMGIYNAAIHLGLTAGPILGVLFAKFLPGNQAFIFYAVVCFLGALVIYFSVENNIENKTMKDTMNFQNIISIATNKETFITLLGITLYGAGYGIFLTILPAFLMSTKGFGSTQTGIFFALFYLAISLSQLITGPLSDKFGPNRFMILGLTVAALGLGIFPSFKQPLITMILTLGSLGLGVFYLSSMAFLNETVPDSLKGTISGAYYLFWGGGMFLGPLIVGKIVNKFNDTGFYLFSLILVFEVLIMIVNYRKTHTDRPQSKQCTLI